MLAKLRIYFDENKMWFYLAQYMLISFLLALAAILVDIRYIPILDYVPNIFLTSVELAKLILSTLAGSLLTITTFTFSTIMVVLTMYSSNFSPRVVNNFLTEKITMKVLGIFVGGFFYCILALFFMRNAYSKYMVISATIAVGYSVLCTIYFVVFVYSVSSSIQASTLIRRLYDEAYESIERVLKGREGHLTVDEYEEKTYNHSLEITSEESGYLILVEFNEILKDIKDLKADLVIEVDMGDFVAKNQRIATIHYNEDDLSVSKQNKIKKSFTYESERVEFNDYRFSLQKIIDITLRAMSPGINDPNTSIHCINILGVIMGKLGEIDGRYTILKDSKTDSQVVYGDFNFKAELYFTFYQIIHYGKKDVSIVIALYNALKTISLAASDSKQETIREFSDYLYESTRDNITNETDIEMVKMVKEAL